VEDENRGFPIAARVVPPPADTDGLCRALRRTASLRASIFSRRFGRPFIGQDRRVRYLVDFRRQLSRRCQGRSWLLAGIVVVYKAEATRRIGRHRPRSCWVLSYRKAVPVQFRTGIILAARDYGTNLQLQIKWAARFCFAEAGRFLIPLSSWVGKLNQAGRFSGRKTTSEGHSNTCL
jgi:hypothetical protein